MTDSDSKEEQNPVEGATQGQREQGSLPEEDKQISEEKEPDLAVFATFFHDPSVVLSNDVIPKPFDGIDFNTAALQPKDKALLLSLKSMTTKLSSIRSHFKQTMKWFKKRHPDENTDAILKLFKPRSEKL